MKNSKGFTKTTTLLSTVSGFLLLLLHSPLCDCLKANIPFSPPDPKLSTIQIAGGDVQAQSIPVGYASTWPVWMVAPDGSSVTRVPDTSFDDGNGWVNPVSFEQIWLPVDLPPPTSTAAIGIVLKDGVPRYLFPTVETTLATKDGGAWHNRGLNSLAIGKTWIPFGDVSLDNLRLSCHKHPLPKDDDEASKEESKDWKEVFPLTGVSDVMELLFNVLAKGPDELGSGFCFLIAPLPVTGTTKQLESTVIAGQRVLCFLSNSDTVPKSLDPNEESTLWTKTRGECDFTVHNVAAGGSSDYLPAAYKQLYDLDQC